MLYPDCHIKSMTDTKLKTGDRIVLRSLLDMPNPDTGTVRTVCLFQEPMSETEQVVYSVNWDTDNDDDYYTGDQLDKQEGSAS